MKSGEGSSRTAGIVRRERCCFRVIPSCAAAISGSAQSAMSVIGVLCIAEAAVRDGKIAQFTAEGNFPLSLSDRRLDELRRWATDHFGISDFSLERASEDASFRRYFR